MSIEDQKEKPIEIHQDFDQESAVASAPTTTNTHTSFSVTRVIKIIAVICFLLILFLQYGIVSIYLYHHAATSTSDAMIFGFILMCALLDFVFIAKIAGFKAIKNWMFLISLLFFSALLPIFGLIIMSD